MACETGRKRYAPPGRCDDMSSGGRPNEPWTRLGVNDRGGRGAGEWSNTNRHGGWTAAAATVMLRWRPFFLLGRPCWRPVPGERDLNIRKHAPSISNAGESKPTPDLKRQRAEAGPASAWSQEGEIGRFYTGVSRKDLLPLEEAERKSRRRFRHKLLRGWAPPGRLLHSGD